MSFLEKLWLITSTNGDRSRGQPRLLLKSFARAPSPIRGVLKVDKKAGEILTADDTPPYPRTPNVKVVELILTATNKSTSDLKTTSETQDVQFLP